MSSSLQKASLLIPAMKDATNGAKIRVLMSLNLSEEALIQYQRTRSSCWQTVSWL